MHLEWASYCLFTPPGPEVEAKGPPTLWYARNVDCPQCFLAEMKRKRDGMLAAAAEWLLTLRVIARERRNPQNEKGKAA